MADNLLLRYSRRLEGAYEFGNISMGIASRPRYANRFRVNRSITHYIYTHAHTHTGRHTTSCYTFTTACVALSTLHQSFVSGPTAVSIEASGTIERSVPCIETNKKKVSKFEFHELYYAATGAT